jgi:hypothetical protein
MSHLRSISILTPHYLFFRKTIIIVCIRQVKNAGRFVKSPAGRKRAHPKEKAERP